MPIKLKKRYWVLIGLLGLLAYWWLFVMMPYFNVKPFYFYHKNTIEFEINGKTYKVTGDRVCRHKSFIPGFYVSTGGSDYRSLNKAFGFRLPNGEGILIRAHDLDCARRSMQSISIPNVYPVIYWLDNANKPSRIEAYYYKSYYASPNSRLKIKNYSIEHSGKSMFPRYSNKDLDPSTTIPWLRERGDRVFRGYYAHVIEEEVWSKIPQLSEAVENLKTLKVFKPGEFAPYFSKLGKYTIGHKNCEMASLEYKASCHKARKIFSFKHENNLLVFDKANTTPGSVNMVIPPIQPGTKLQKNYPFRKGEVINLRVFGDVFQMQADISGGLYAYSPKNKMFFQLRVITLLKRQFK